MYINVHTFLPIMRNGLIQYVCTTNHVGYIGSAILIRSTYMLRKIFNQRARNKSVRRGGGNEVPGIKPKNKEDE